MIRCPNLQKPEIPMLRNFLIAIGISSLVCAVIFLPEWGEDPRKLAPGEWKEASRRGLQAEVDEQGIRWHGFGRRGKLTYEWLQTDTEPYRVKLLRGQTGIEANVTFNGADEAVLEPDIFDQLPDIAKTYIRDTNKRHKRPEKEVILIFHRVEAKESD